MKIDYDFSGKTLILMMGLPYSGKSTRAIEISDEFRAPIVSPDALRVALHGERFLGPAELLVWPLAHLAVRALFLAGHNTVIVDATNTTRARRDQWRTSEGWDVVVEEMGTPRAVCIERALAVGDAAILPIIERQADAYEDLGDDEDCH